MNSHLGFDNLSGTLPVFRGVHYEDSCPRHPHSRSVSASVRRTGMNPTGLRRQLQLHDEGVGGSYDAREHKEMDEGEDDPGTRGLGSDVHYDDDVEDAFMREFERDLDLTVDDRWNVRKGRGGWFIRGKGSSSSVESRKGKGKDVGDLSWKVRGPVAGGPMVESVIPSFGGHVAMEIWEGGDRTLLKCQREDLCTFEDMG